MPYVISNSSGESIVIPDGDLNQDFSIDLVGRNYPNYGSVVAETFIRLLDNFATNATPPVRPVAGQLWYDKNFKQVRIFDGAGSWRPSGILVATTTPNNVYNQLVAGTSFFNSVTRQYFIHDGLSFRRAGLPGEVSAQFNGNATLGSPSNYGTRIRNIYLEDTGGVPRAVLAIMYTNSASTYADGEKIVALISGHDPFDAANTPSNTEGITRNYYDQLTEVGGIGVSIRKGINLRADDTTKVPFAFLADRASTSYALNTGSFGSDGANISASNVYHKDANLISNLHDAYTVGAANTVFSAGYFRDLFIGNGTTGSILPNGNSIVNIGTVGSPINSIYVTDITVEGDITFPSGGDLGTPSDPITNIYVEELTANVVNIDGYTMPTTAGSEGDQIYILANGDAFWDRRSSEIEDVTAGGGIVVNRTQTSLINGVIGVDSVQVSVGEGRGITVNAGNVEVDLGDFNTDDLGEGATNLYHTTARARTSITGTDGVTYDQTTGVISLAGGEADFVKIVSGGTGLTTTRAGSVVTLNVGAGPGIITNPTNVAVDSNHVRNLFSAGDGIAFNSSTGQISLDFTNDFDNQNILSFVRTTGNQTVGGIKTFTANTPFTAGLTTNVINHSGLSLGVVTISTNGTITTPGDISGLSDIRVKTNIRPIEESLSKVKQLHGKIYDRTDNDMTQAGLIAQDVYAVLPEAISVGDDGLMYVNVVGPVALLVEAVKELSQLLEETRAELKQLRRNVGK